MTLRSMDDIKESVRQAGIALARSAGAGLGRGVHAPARSRRSEHTSAVWAPPAMSQLLTADRHGFCPLPLSYAPRRSVRGLTLRLADAELTPAAQGREAIGLALPLLLETGTRCTGWQQRGQACPALPCPALHAPPVLPCCAGLPSQVPEVRGLALDTTCKLAAAAGPELLRPHMPLLVPAMLESLRWAVYEGGE